MPGRNLLSGRILIVARLPEGGHAEVAELFQKSDDTSLPVDLGVRSRHLFGYHGLYFHYVEFDGDPTAAMAKAREREDFVALSEDLGRFVQPYDPTTWRSPADAMARGFYSWHSA